MFVTYKLSDNSFFKLQKKGLSEEALNDLAELKNKVFKSPEPFLNRVRKLPQAEEIPGMDFYLWRLGNTSSLFFYFAFFAMQI